MYIESKDSITHPPETSLKNIFFYIHYSFQKKKFNILILISEFEGFPEDIEAIQLPSNTFTGLGRITGSASIETLVRVGIEKENGLSPDSKMVVLHEFTPCVDDELQVKKGQV